MNITKEQLEQAYRLFPPFQGKHGHNFKDWSGVEQGFLKVLYCAQEKKENRSAFVCLCECGKYTLISSASLRKGQQSCGCKASLTRRQAYQDNLTGKQFGILTVKEPDYSRPGYWFCSCQCGQNKSIAKSSLLKGSTKSCGCKSKEWNADAHTKPIEVGTRVGKLTVTTNSFKKKKTDTHYYQTCICDCGRTVDIRSSVLISGKVQSCGCTKSKGELMIKTFLENGFGVFVEDIIGEENI